MRELDFRAAGYRRFQLSAPWAIAFDQDGLRGIHLVTEGSCEIVITGELPVRLDPGDLVITPSGQSHVLRSVGAGAVSPVRSLDLAGQFEAGILRHGGGGADTALICGAFVFDRTDHAALAGLPRMVRVAGSDPAAARWMKGYVDILKAEATDAGPGSDLVLGRLTSALVVMALRHSLDQVDAAGWLKGLRDPGIARALAAIHADFARPWTVDSLAQEAGQSRAVFAARFRAMVGEAPVKYLHARRMREAAARLRQGKASLAQIAETIGYGSEAALSSAFRRHFGMSPGRYRRDPTGKDAALPSGPPNSGKAP